MSFNNEGILLLIKHNTVLEVAPCLEAPTEDDWKPIGITYSVVQDRNTGIICGEGEVSKKWADNFYRYYAQQLSENGRTWLRVNDDLFRANLYINIISTHNNLTVFTFKLIGIPQPCL